MGAPNHRAGSISRRRFLLGASAGACAFAGRVPVGRGAAAAVATETTRDAATFRVPIDSARHTRTWMAWPDSPEIWGTMLAGAQHDIAQIARTIARYEPVILCANRPSRREAVTACGRGVDVIDAIPVDDCWMRDAGPVFRLGGAGALDAVGLNFNGWGNRQRHGHDAHVARRVAELIGVPFGAARLVAEGGAIEYDGAGTLMATRSSIVNPNRNPGRSRTELERAMCAAYGASKVLWFGGIAGRDITDDHVDATSRFTGRGAAIVQVPEQASEHDIWSEDQRDQYELLSHATDAHGEPVRVTRLPGPDWSRIRQRRHPGFVDSYANYYVCNGAVLAAQFGDQRRDAAAAAALAAAFPGRAVELLNIDNLGNGGGGIHCVTQQQPAP